MFESVPVNPPDAIFGLNEEFKRDPNPDKINLTVGMYQDQSGETPIMGVVRTAIERFAETASSRVYLPIDGYNPFNAQMPELVFGRDHPVVQNDRCRTSQTPGGTAALRVAGEMLHRKLGTKNVWISNPTWANHANIFQSAGLNVLRYDYLDAAGTGLDFQRLIESMKLVGSGDAVVLHAVCHNPTGVDPDRQQWDQLIDAIVQRDAIPIFDFAYQGFGTGVNEDAYCIRQYCRRAGSALICNSFSKNFNLYGERVGALIAVAPTAEDAAAVHSQIKSVIRSIYSNPPSFGGYIVATVLDDAALMQRWKQELESMRVRIASMREKFVRVINDSLGDNRFDHILHQRGMFSYSGISAEVVEILKNQHSIYLLKSGRINVAGINDDNVERICNCIATTLKETVGS